MAGRGIPKGAKNLSELLEDREQWKKDVRIAVVSARRASGLTQSEAAGSLGITQPYLSQIESGSRTPSDETLRKLMSLTEGARDGNQGEAQ